MISEKVIINYIKDLENVSSNEKIVSLSYNILKLKNLYTGQIMSNIYSVSYSIHTLDNKKGRSKISKRIKEGTLENFQSFYRDKRLKELLD